MKKIVVVVIICLMLALLCGCNSDDNETTHTETKENLLITYIYANNELTSKNVYNKNTGITTEYFYFYDNHGCGTHLVDIKVVTITKDGKIIGQFGNN